MIRVLLLFAIVLVVAVTIGTLAWYFGPGYLAFSFNNYTIETSFIFALSAVTISFFIFYYVLRLLSFTFRLPDKLGLRYTSRQAEKARSALVQGLIEMSEGRFEKAEKILIRQAVHSDTSLLNYLLAARVAQQLGAYDRRDDYLRLAHESTPTADIAISLTQAELQLSHQQYEQALATLNHLSSVAPRHDYVKKLQARVYQQLGDWDSLLGLLDQVRKSHFISAKKLHRIEIDTYSGKLNMQLKQEDIDGMKHTWHAMPRALQKEADILYPYLQALIAHDENNAAEALIRSFLSQQWQDRLALLYGEITTDNATRQLETAETWLHSQQRNPILLLVLGKLCLKAHLWGKAKTYLETSLSIEPSAAAYLLLAQLLEQQMDDADEAQKYYRKGLMLAVENSDFGSEVTLDDQNDDKPSGAPQLKLIH